MISIEGNEVVESIRIQGDVYETRVILTKEILEEFDIEDGLSEKEIEEFVQEWAIDTTGFYYDYDVVDE